MHILKVLYGHFSDERSCFVHRLHGFTPNARLAAETINVAVEFVRLSITSILFETISIEIMFNLPERSSVSLTPFSQSLSNPFHPSGFIALFSVKLLTEIP